MLKTQKAFHSLTIMKEIFDKEENFMMKVGGDLLARK